LVDDLVLRLLQVTDCKGSRHGRDDAKQRSYGNSHEQPFGSRRKTSVRLLSHESLLRLRGKALNPPVLLDVGRPTAGEAGHKVSKLLALSFLSEKATGMVTGRNASSRTIAMEPTGYRAIAASQGCEGGCDRARG
jgi:hypothetical protein